MTRDDVANLVLRTFALWLGATGLAALGSAPWMMAGPGGVGAIALIALAYIAAGAFVWWAATPMTRAIFARPDRDVPFALTAQAVPPLACFVAGVFVLVVAVPQAISWLAMRVMLHRMESSLLGSPDTRAMDLQSAGTGAEILARIVVGVIALALSRRADLWPTPDVATGGGAEPDPPARVD